MVHHTISSALRRIKAISGELAEIDGKIPVAIRFEKGHEPTYRFEALASQRGSLITEITNLRTRVALANARTVIGDESLSMTLTEAVQTLAQIKSDLAFYARLPTYQKKEETVIGWDLDYEDVDTQGRARRIKKEHEFICDLTELARDELITALRARFADLNSRVEHLNHITEI